MYSRAFPSDTQNRRDPHPVLWIPNGEICFTLHVETKPARCRLFGKSPAPLREHVEDTSDQPESIWEYRSIAQKTTCSSYTFTAYGKTAPGGFLGRPSTARSAQPSLTTGDGSLALTSEVVCRGSGLEKNHSERREPSSKGGLSWFERSGPQRPRLGSSAGKAVVMQPPAPGSTVVIQPEDFPCREALTSSQNPFSCTPGSYLSSRLQSEGTRGRVKVRGTFVWVVPFMSFRGHVLSGSPRAGHPPGQSMQTAAAFGDKPGKLLWPHGYLSTGHGLGQTGLVGRILTGDVELDGSAGHQLCPEQKMNAKFLLSHGFHPDPLYTWSQYIFFLLNT